MSLSLSQCLWLTVWHSGDCPKQKTNGNSVCVHLSPVYYSRLSVKYQDRSSYKHWFFFFWIRNESRVSKLRNFPLKWQETCWMAYFPSQILVRWMCLHKMLPSQSYSLMPLSLWNTVHQQYNAALTIMWYNTTTNDNNTQCCK